MNLKPAVLALAASAALACGAGAQTAAPDPVEQLTRAKALFEQTCNVCHALERPLSKTFDRTGWERTIERMHDNGAEIDAAGRAMVVAFLFAKNTFEAKCSTCHGIDQSLGASKSAAGWLATVRRMAALKPDHVSEADATAIAAYLAVVRPEQKQE